MLSQSRELLLLLVAGTLAGCGGGEDLNRFKEGLVPVSGTVTLDGKPLEGAGVVFIPASAARVGAKGDVGSRMAMGETDAQGKYSLISPPHGAQAVPSEYPGCLPGEYVIALDRRRMPDGSIPDPTKDEPTAMQAEQTIPAKYVNPMSSGLKATVGAGGGSDFNFDLTSK